MPAIAAPGGYLVAEGGDLVLDGPNDAHAINNFLAPGYMDLYVIHPRHSAYRPPWNLFMRKRHASVKDVEAGLHD
jgi:hypothetical protein